MADAERCPSGPAYRDDARGMKNLFSVLSARAGLFATRGATVGMNFLSMMIIAYLMGVSEYGRFVIVWASAQIVAVFLSQGLPVYLLREFAVRQKLGDNGVTPGFLLRRGLVLPVLFCLVLSACAWGAARVWPGLPLDLLPAILALAFLLNLNTLLCSALHALDWQSLSMFVRDALPQTLTLVAAGTLAMAGRIESMPVVLLSLALLAVWIGLTIAFLAVKGRVLALLGTGAQPPGRLGHFWLSSALGAALAQIDIVIGGLFLSAEELGAYNILRRVANLAALPVTIATWATVGEFSRAFATRDRAAIEAANRKALLLAVPPGLALVALCVPLYPVLALIYDLSGLEMIFATYLVLLAQSAVVVFFGAGLTILTSSGLEAFSFFARLVSSGTYLIFVMIFELAAVFGSLENSLSVLASSVILGALIRKRILLRFCLETSASLFARKSVGMDAGNGN